MMIEQSKLPKITAALIAVSLLFGFLSYLKIRYQFYLWEILVDLKIISVIGLFFYYYRTHDLSFDPALKSFFSFDWKKNILWFFVPLFVYAVTIGAGLASGEVKINKMENAVTLILATVFDIPAIYVFSATSILIEEIVFRGYFQKTFERRIGSIPSIIMVSLLWTVFMVSDIVGSEVINILESSVLTLFFFSVGIFLSILSVWKGNVWTGYSLRIGLITLTPIILTSRINESDSFFTSESLLFIAEGIVVSSIFVIFAAFVMIIFRKNSAVTLN